MIDFIRNVLVLLSDIWKGIQPIFNLNNNFSYIVLQQHPYYCMVGNIQQIKNDVHARLCIWSIGIFNKKRLKICDKLWNESYFVLMAR